MSESAPRIPREPRLLLALVAAAIAIVGVLVGLLAGPLVAGLTAATGSSDPVSGEDVPMPSSDPDGFRFARLADPARTVVTDQQGVVVATFTDGSRTVTVAGRMRMFAEPRYTRAVVRTATWVRLAPRPWSATAQDDGWVRPWLVMALSDTSDDVLATAMQYLRDAPDRVDDAGVRYAGNASFGPELSSGKREIGADFYDYLGVPWTFPDGAQKAPADRHDGALDCSGFLRLVYGYRQGYPLLSSSDPGPGLPRRAHAMAVHGPGTVVLDGQQSRPAALDRLQPGDLLFFTTDDEPDIDHSAIYLGRDTDGLHRFVSSRATPNGPTIGDLGGPSVLDGDAFYAERFRIARRI